MRVRTLPWVVGLTGLMLLASCEPSLQSRQPPTAAAAVAGTVRLSTEILIEKSAGCRMGGGRVSLLDQIITQDNPNHIVIEAEDAVQYVWQEGVGALTRGRKLDPNAVVQIYAGEDREYSPRTEKKHPEKVGGGKYINYTHHAVYVFRCTHPGTYTLWARHFLPRTAGWQYRHQVDGNEVDVITLSHLPAKTWFWTRGQTVVLTEGTHVFHVTNLHGGKRLDRLVFAQPGTFRPVGVPTGKKKQTERKLRGKLNIFSEEIGPPASPHVEVAEGFVISEPVRPLGAVSFDALILVGDRNGGTIRTEVSLDRGATWQPVPASGDLSGIRLASGKDPTALFKFILKRGPGGSPAIQGVELTYAAAADRFIVLENKHFRLRFDRQTGAPCGILNRTTRQTIQPEGLRSDLLEVHLKKGPSGNGPYPPAPIPEGVTLTLKDAKVLGVKSTPRSLTARYAFLEGALLITIRVRIDETPLSRWSIQVANHSEMDVLWVRWPKLQRLKVGESSLDDVLAYPRIGGDMVPTPAQAGSWALGYPGRASLGYFDLFDDRGGLYFATYDPALIAVDMEVDPRLDADHLDFSMRKRHRLRKGMDFTWTYAVGIHPGSWYWGADRYRKWFRGTFGKPDYPQWLKDCDGWVASSYMRLPLNRTTYEKSYRLGLEQNLRYGYRYKQVWATTGRGACPSYYLPLRELGGEDSFTRINKWWHDQGGIVGYYLHGNAIGGAYVAVDKYWTTPWSEYPRSLRPPSWEWYVRNRSYNRPDMKVKKQADIERYKRALAKGAGMDNYARMTMGRPAWRDFQNFWGVKQYNDRYYVDVIYWDTFAWGGETSEWNPHLGFFGDGNIALKRVRWLRRNLNDARKANPDYAQLTEGCVDVYGVHCYHMISGFSRDPEMFRYTFPEHIVFEGHQNGGWGSPEGSFKRIESAFLYGNKFDLYEHLLHSLHLRDIIYLRKWFSPWQNQARFMDNLGLKIGSPDIQGKVHWIQTPDARGVLVTFRNLKQIEGVRTILDLDNYGAPKRAFLFELGQAPRPLPHAYRDGRARFVVPRGRVSAVLFVEKAEGRMAWHASAYQEESDGIRVQLSNFTGRELEAEATCEGERAVIRVPANQAGTHLFTPADRLTRTVAKKVNLRVRVGGDERSLFQGWFPAVYDGSFELGGVAHPEARDGKKVLRLSGKRRRARVRLSLKEGKRYRLSFRIKQSQGGARARINTGVLAERFWGKWEKDYQRLTVKLPKKTGEWAAVSITFTPLGRGRLFFESGNKNQEVLVDAVQVEEVE